MKKIKIYTYILIMLIVFAATCFATGCTKVYRSVLVDSFEGICFIDNNDVQETAFEGRKLVPGEVVKTEEDSKITLRVDEDKHILMSEKSAVSIDATGDETKGKVSVNLVYGQTLIEIDNKLQPGDSFEVDTNNATMAVRGTKFVVLYDDTDKTSVEVIEGTVEVKDKKSGKTELLEAGMSATVTEDGVKVEDKLLGLSDSIAGGQGQAILSKMKTLFENELLVMGRPLWDYTAEELLAVYTQSGSTTAQIFYGDELSGDTYTIFDVNYSGYMLLNACYDSQTGKLKGGTLDICDREPLKKYEIFYSELPDSLETVVFDPDAYMLANDDLVFQAVIDSFKELGLTTTEGVCEYFEVTNDEEFLNTNTVKKSFRDYTDIKDKKPKIQKFLFVIDDGDINDDNFWCTIIDVYDYNPYIEQINIHINKNPHSSMDDIISVQFCLENTNE